MADLTDDELTELECAILDACAEKRAQGWVIEPNFTYRPHSPHNVVFGFPMAGVCCPIGALCGMVGQEDEEKVWQRFFHVAGFEANGFDAGFDGLEDYECSPGRERQLFDMGRRFRERLDAGELW